MRLLVLGEHGVGKSAIVRWFLGQGTQEGVAGVDIPSTVGVDFHRKAIQLERDPWPTRLHVWDTSGQERFRSLVDQHLQNLENSDAVVVVYDIADRASFEAVDRWVQAARHLAKGSPQIALLGSKSDKAAAGHRAVMVDEGQRKADEVGAVLFLETCAMAPAGDGTTDAERLAKLLTETLLRRCRAAETERETPGDEMPGLPRLPAIRCRERAMPSSGASYLCRCPWRPLIKCFGFA